MPAPPAPLEPLQGPPGGVPVIGEGDDELSAILRHLARERGNDGTKEQPGQEGGSTAFWIALVGHHRDTA